MRHRVILVQVRDGSGELHGDHSRVLFGHLEMTEGAGQVVLHDLCHHMKAHIFQVDDLDELQYGWMVWRADN